MADLVQSGLLILREYRTTSGKCILDKVWLELNVIVGRISEDSLLLRSWELMERSAFTFNHYTLLQCCLIHTSPI